ncbi:hypothetical protein [Nocardia callitridis]|uniref:Ribbon-helix-helix protein CopG domain-containing protein n=1 Tax=Nocardia callitridis TaxID=648753 RepID=A0ABP9KRG6_9NOCA
MVESLAQDLSDGQVAVLDRRARARGLSRERYVSQALAELARDRSADDTIVDFLREQGRDLRPEWDREVAALVETYELTADVLDTFGARARAVGSPLCDYVRQQLVRLARRSTVEDAMLELREAQERDPSLDIDMDAVAASMRYVRGE